MSLHPSYAIDRDQGIRSRRKHTLIFHAPTRHSCSSTLSPSARNFLFTALFRYPLVYRTYLTVFRSPDAIHTWQLWAANQYMTQACPVCNSLHHQELT